MIIKYKNYTIEPDRNSFILREVRTYTKGENIGESYEHDTIYPSTLARAVLCIFEREMQYKEGEIQLEDLAKELKEQQNEFIKELETLFDNK